jgi:hypothetical protein
METIVRTVHSDTGISFRFGYTADLVSGQIADKRFSFYAGKELANAIKPFAPQICDEILRNGLYVLIFNPMFYDEKEETNIKDTSVVLGDLKSTTKIDVLDLLERTRLILFHAGITQVGELIRKSEIDLLKMNGIGRKYVADVKEALSKWNLQLGMKIRVEEPEIDCLHCFAVASYIGNKVLVLDIPESLKKRKDIDYGPYREMPSMYRSFNQLLDKITKNSKDTTLSEWGFSDKEKV